MKEYDVIIAGGGVAGAFAAYRIAKQKNIKACLIEFGRPPGKRRKQLEGWLGCFPTSNTRLYLDDIQKVESLVGSKNAAKYNDIVLDILSDYGPLKPNKSKKPQDTIKNKINQLGYTAQYLNYVQWKPENVHLLSRGIADFINESGNVDLEFDNEIKSITYKDKFIVETELGTFASKKLILCIGRSGWRFARTIFKNLNIIESDDISQVGFMAEIPASSLRDWNGSHCILTKDDLTIGPLSYNGTVIPEDHVDLVISSWRSNEERWFSERVAFPVRMKQSFPNNGAAQTERLGKLAFVLSDSRIGKIKVSEYINGHHDLSLIPEYNWLKDTMNSIGLLIPSFLTKGYLSIPNINLTIPKINIQEDLSVKQLNDLYVAGESAGVFGLFSACMMGYIAGETACK